MSRELSFIPGATTVGVVFDKGVVLASEKRIAYAYFVLSKVGKKVFKLTDKIGIACAGLVGDMQLLAMEVAAHIKLHSLECTSAPTVKSVAKVVANLLFERRFFPLLTQTIIGGVDSRGPYLSVLDPLGSVIPDKFACVGSGTEIATGIIETQYKDGITLAEAKSLTIESIKAAASRDIQSGDGVDLLIITDEEIKEETIAIK